MCVCVGGKKMLNIGDMNQPRLQDLSVNNPDAGQKDGISYRN